MLTLAINTASSVTGIALLDGVLILAEDSWSSQNNEAERLMPAIDSLLKKCDKTFEDLEAVLAISGPGSFTGLRIGVTTANTIAYLLGCKLFAVNTFEYWHAQSALPVLVFAGKGGVYFSEKANEPASEIQQLTLEELPEIISGKNITEVCGDISDEQKEILHQHHIIFHPAAISFGQACAQLLSDDSTLGSPLTPVATITPLYVKSPAITISKKNG